jgi:type I restriction enzyme S subunit
MTAIATKHPQTVGDDWDCKSLGDVCRPVGGGTPSRAQPNYWNGNIPWASVKDFSDDSLVLSETQEHISQEGLESSASTLIPSGTPVICTRMAVGRCAVTTRPTAINQDLKALPLSDDFELDFFIRLLRFHAPDLDRVSIGSTVRGITTKDLLKLPLRFPQKPNQARIAAVLDTADEAIAKTEVVIAKLRQVRSGLIHDLLTCGLDENGHLRDPIAHPEQFQETTLGLIPRDWDILQLRDTIERVYDYRGRTPLKIGMDWGGGDIPALSANNVEMGQVNFAKEAHLGSPTLYAKWMTQGDTEEGDVLMTMEAPLGNIAQVPDNKRYILSQRVILLRPKPQRFTKDYLALQMAGPRFQKELFRQSSGSTAVGIQRAKLELIQVAIPRRQEEQERATQIVHLNDKQIRQHEAELIKLQSIKFGLMDDLLTGRVRVPESTP